MNLQVENLTTIQNCSHPTIGKLLNISCFGCSAVFKSGINFVCSDIFEEGWLLSYTLSKGRIQKITEGKFCLDGNIIEFDKLRKLTYYVGYDEMILYKKMSVNCILHMCKYWTELKDKIYSMLLDDFDDKYEILNRKFEQMGHSAYFYSCIVGVAKGKKILCFPWIPRKEMEIQLYRLKLLSDYVLSNDIIIIIPTNSIVSYQSEIEFSYNYIVTK